MSGGHLNYIQWKETQDILNNTNSLSEIEYASKYLASFGELGAKAIAKNDEALVKLRALRDQIQREIEALDATLEPLRGVWRSIDFHGSNDIGDEDIIAVLTKFNESQG